MNKCYGLLHVPDSTVSERSLPAWYAAVEADQRIASLESELRDVRRQRDQYSRQLFTVGQILGDWATGRHAQGKRANDGK